MSNTAAPADSAPRPAARALVLEHPIFFIGMPRSGTTVIFEAFAAHPRLGWLSNYSNRFPSFPEIAAVHRVFGRARGRKDQDLTLPVLSRLFPEPSESYVVWERFFGSAFSYSFLENDKPAPRQIEDCRRYMSRLLRAERKGRLCVKFTGPPRKRFLEAVFPGALFVNVVRDPRAVVASLLSVQFWKERGMSRPFWEGGLTEQELETWRSADSSPAVLAALLWCAVCRATERETTDSSAPLLSIRYESFVDDPLGETKRLLTFCQLNDASAVERYVSLQAYRRDTNAKFSRMLSAKDVRQIERITESYRQVYCYE